MGSQGSDTDDFNQQLAEAQAGHRAKQHEAIRHEAFVHGFIAARDPKTAVETLLLCVEADAAYATWRSQR